MGRRSSSSFKKTPTNLPRKTNNIPKSNLPKPTQPANSTTSTIGDSVKQGVGLGIGMGLGSSMANLAVDKLTNNTPDTQSDIDLNTNNQNNFNNCKHILEIYQDCVKQDQSDKCDIFLNHYDKCRNGFI